MKVLLLGRISETRQAIHHMLTARGHDVIVTDNRDVFWAEFIRDTYPMMFLDLSIAGYPELQLCRHIRSISRDKRNLIIVYGLRGQEVHADLLIDAGVDEYLSIDSTYQEELDNRVILFEHHAWLASVRQQASAASQAVYENLFNHLSTAPLAVIEWDRELCVLHWSQGAVRIFGWRASDVVGKSAMDWPFIPDEDTAQVFISLSALVDGLEDRQTITRRILTSTGESMVTEWLTSVLRNVSGQFVSAMSVVVDVTQREDVLDAARAQERRYSALIERASDFMFIVDAGLSITYVSPSVERALGHDATLMPGGMILELVHPDDRDGIRELLAGLAESPALGRVMTELYMQQANGRWQLVEATATSHLDDPAIAGIILMARDISSRYAVQTEGAHRQEAEQREILVDAREAVADSQLVIQYQPEVDLNTGKLARFEALVAWRHPGRGLIYAGDLVDLVNDSSMNRTVENWVLTEACRAAAGWTVRRPSAEQPAVSVNITDRAFQEPQFVDLVRAVLAETGLDPARLKLEVDESAIAPSDSKTILNLTQLNDLNVRIAIDRFGSGYASLDRLAQLTVETIKIDPALVSGASSLTGSLSILRAVTSLAHAVGIDVVAQGIETQEQREWVISAGCDRGQGTYLHPPMDSAGVQALLDRIEDGT